MNKILRKRLTRLERLRPPEPKRELTEEEISYRKFWLDLIERMDPLHADYVLRDLAERGGKSNLTLATEWMAIKHLREGTPLELPACAAEVYLQNPDAHPTQQCAECGFLSPFTWGSRFTDPPRPTISYLKTCPLCGGTITWPSHSRYNRNRHTA